MIFISLWVNDDCSLQSHDYPTICIMHVNRVMRISIFLCGQGFFSICFHFMIGKRYHVLWRFSSALCSHATDMGRNGMNSEARSSKWCCSLEPPGNMWAPSIRWQLTSWQGKVKVQIPQSTLWRRIEEERCSSTHFYRVWLEKLMFLQLIEMFICHFHTNTNYFLNRCKTTGKL